MSRYMNNVDYYSDQLQIQVSQKSFDEDFI